MKLPELYDIPSARSVAEEFLGLNQNLRIGAGEFAAMENLTSDYYPVLSTRKQRGVYKDDGSYLAIHARDRLCWIQGTDVYINGYKVTGLTLTSTTPKQMVSMGAYIVIFPDKVWVNTIEGAQHSFTYGNLEAEFNTLDDTPVTLSPCDIEGNVYQGYIRSDTAPENPDNGALWMDISGATPVLKEFSSSQGMWVGVTSTYVKVETSGVGSSFEVGDGVSFFSSVQSASSLNGVTVIQKKGTDYIVIPGIIDNVYSDPSSYSVSVERKSPDLDFVIESGNRIWGCHYGLSQSGTEVVNEIYASKLGDFKNWNVFEGVSTDSYTVSVGTDGQFTGAVNYLGYPLFFKEDCIHKIYGNYPANYQVQTTTCRGVQRGSENSIAIVNEVLFYKSISDVCAYDGSLPSSVSSALGEVRYKNASAGTVGGKYYISMQEAGATENAGWNFFAYDIGKGLWHREDDLHVNAFAALDGELYMLSGGNILTELGTGLPDIDPIRWYAESGVIGLSSPDTKSISKISVRLRLAAEAHVRFFAEYDSIPGWQHLCSVKQRLLRSVTVPLKPRRCDHLRIRIEGVGDCKIYSVTYTTVQGSDKT